MTTIQPIRTESVLRAGRRYRILLVLGAQAQARPFGRRREFISGEHSNEKASDM
jgi:hypothetical protein